MHCGLFHSLQNIVLGTSKMDFAPGDRATNRRQGTQPFPMTNRSLWAANYERAVKVTSQSRPTTGVWPSEFCVSLGGLNNGGGNLSWWLCSWPTSPQLPHILIGIMYHWLPVTIFGPHRSQLIQNRLNIISHPNRASNFICQPPKPKEQNRKSTGTKSKTTN